MENQEDQYPEEAKVKTEYKGYSIPLPLKIVWVIFIAWGIGYSLYYAIPDLKVWLAK